MAKPFFHAFTIKYSGRTNVLFTEVALSEPFDLANTPKQAIPSLTKCRAIWDTGATVSAITKDLARKIGLKPFTKVPVSNTSETKDKDAYYVNVQLPNKVMLGFVKVVECETLVGGFEFLVGMDIISAGDFAVTHGDGKTTLSYRIPSIKTVDYVEEANAQNAQPDRKSKLSKVARREKRKKERKNKKKARGRRR